jgi:hypothetical protein
MTVRRILKKYADANRVCRIPGKGTFVAGPEGDTQEEIDAPRSSAQIIADVIAKGIRQGEFKKGDALSSIKYMSLRFKVTPSTVIAAYKMLLGDGLVTRVGKTYWVGSRYGAIARGRPKKPVDLLLCGTTDFSRVFLDDMMAPAYRKFEKELSAHGYLLRHRAVADVERLELALKKDKGAPAGVVLFRMEQMELLDALVEQFTRHSQSGGAGPIRVLVDWAGSGVLPRLPRRVNVLSRANMTTVGARTVASFLVESGFRNAIFFLCEGTGYDESKGALWGSWAFMKLRTEIKQMNPSFAFRILAKTDDAADSVATFVENMLSMGTLENAQSILSKYQPTPLEDLVAEIEVTNDFGKVFERSRGESVWVFSTDADAAAAYAWAKSHRIRIPQDLSIIGLQNDPAYYHLGLTMFEHDFDAIGYLMAHAVIGDFPIEKTSKGYLRTRAIITERLTTP